MRTFRARFGTRSLMALVAAAALYAGWARHAREGRPPRTWIKLLEAGDVDNRRIGAWRLSEVADAGEAEESATPLIRALLEDEDLEVRASCARTLGRLFGREGMAPAPQALAPALLLALKDPEPVVRAAAAACLGSIESDPTIAASPLVALADDADPRTREAAAEALSLIVRASDVLPAGADGAIIKIIAAADPHSHGGTSAARSFARVAERSPSLAAAAMRNGPLQVRREITGILSLPGYIDLARKLIPALLDALRDADDEVRRNAASALLHNAGDLALSISDDQAVPRLVGLLDDADPQVRRSAIQILGRYRSRAKDALPALAKAGGDPDPDVRSLAPWAQRVIEAELNRPATDPRPPAK